MCAHYFAYSEQDVIEINKIIEDWNKTVFTTVKLSTGDVFPKNIAPVMTDAGITPMKWGFPGFKKNAVIFNARSETVWEKPLFRAAVDSRRCVVPAACYFEWGSNQPSFLEDAPPKKVSKAKYRFTLPGAPMFYLAGFYSHYPIDGLSIPHFVVLTTAANDSVSPVHDRMPVILRAGETEDWLERKKMPDISPALDSRQSA
jgi:putative SOS response-associated peptidase YedK